MAKGSRKICANCKEENLLKYTECRNCGVNLAEASAKKFKFKFLSISSVVAFIMIVGMLGENDNTTNNVSTEKEASCSNYSVTAEKLNVREDAQKSSDVIRVASKGDVVCVYNFNGKWGQLNNGWISGKHLEKA